MDWFLIKAVVEGLIDRSVLSKVESSFFTSEEDKKVWNLLKLAFKKGKLITTWRDLYVFALREGTSASVIDRIEWLESSGKGLSSDLVLDTIDKVWKERVVLEGVKRIEEKLLKGVDIDDVAKDFGETYRKVFVESLVKAGTREDVFSGVMERLMNYAIQFKREDRLLSGFSQLDAVLGGGYRRGTITVWLGATSVGKTMMLVFQSVMFMLQGKNVLFISLEDSKDVILERFDSVLFGNVRESVEEVVRRVEFLKELGRVEVMYSSRLSIVELESLVEGCADWVDVLVVDYGDLVHLGKSFKEADWVEQGEVFERMMRIADKYDKWVVTASQANREAVNKKVLSLDNVSRSYRKVQVADYVMAISQTKDEEQQGLLRIVVLKNKFGKRGDIISLRVFREYGFFREEWDSC
jgi:KaiC/GvpD/RAD55 family RecA-like ATPase